MLKSVLITVDKEIYNVVSYNFLKLSLVTILIHPSLWLKYGEVPHTMQPAASLVSWLQPDSAMSDSHDHLYTVMGSVLKCFFFVQT